MRILNLGCGRNTKPECINVDIKRYPGVDMSVDLSIFPWPWNDSSIDGIYASHIIEHFPDQKKFINECLRILRVGGFLRLNVPHSSCVSSVGCLGHYRTYSYDTLRQYLSKDYYMFGKAKFDTTEQKLLWWYEVPDAQGELSKPIRIIISVLNPVINFFARLSPKLCENLWCYWIGGMREVVWRGIKI